MDLDEVWLEAPYRGHGIGSALAHKVAAMAMFSLRELDAKAFERLDEPLELPIVVGGDVYSKSGEQFVESVADILHDEIGLSDWQALSTGSFIWDARW